MLVYVYTGVKSTVKTALEEALVRILTPKKNIDFLRDVLQAKQQQRPYTIVFVGVNGVGKSTNLAKVPSFCLDIECYYNQLNDICRFAVICNKADTV